MRLETLLPVQALNEPRVIMTGTKEVIVEGHCGLFSYETSCIRLRTKAGLMAVQGDKLTIEHFGAQDAKICGQVESVSILEAG